MNQNLPKRNAARRNKSTTRATLTRDHDVVAPALPDSMDWDDLTLAWWADVWASPMAPEYDSSDLHGLYALAALVNLFWLERNPRVRSVLAAEMRLQRQCFGLSPIDRRRLQWEIERTEDAQDRGKKRRARATQDEPVDAGDDPRSVLRLA